MEHKFQTGDIVIRARNGNHSNVKEGQTYTVKRCTGLNLYLEEVPGGYTTSYFDLVTPIQPKEPVINNTYSIH